MPKKRLPRKLVKLVENTTSWASFLEILTQGQEPQNPHCNMILVILNWSTILWESRIFPPQIVSLWHDDDFRLIIFMKQKSQEDLFTSSLTT